MACGGGSHFVVRELARAGVGSVSPITNEIYIQIPIYQRTEGDREREREASQARWPDYSLAMPAQRRTVENQTQERLRDFLNVVVPFLSECISITITNVTLTREWPKDIFSRLSLYLSCVYSFSFFRHLALSYCYIGFYQSYIYTCLRDILLYIQKRESWLYFSFENTIYRRMEFKNLNRRIFETWTCPFI